MAFHPYPRLIQELFNARWFGPPSGVTRTSAWPGVDHPVSRLPPRTKHALSTLALAAAPALKGVNLARGGNSQVHYAKGTPSHAKHAPTACRRAGSGSLSTPCAGCFSPFPHGTCALSVSREYLALPDGPGGFGRGSTCPALLRCGQAPSRLRVRGSHPLRPAFPGRSARRRGRHAVRPTTPGTPRRPRFGLIPGRSPLLGESLLSSSPAGTGMFRFPAFASP